MARPFAQVALPVPVEGSFTYRVPDALDAAAAPGALVVVPFGRKRLIGVVLERTATSPVEGRVEAKEILSSAGLPPLPLQLVELARWAASYYLSPLGLLLRLLLPPSARKGPARLRLTEKGREALLGSEPPPLVAAFRRGERTAGALEKAFGAGELSRALAEGLVEPSSRASEPSAPYHREEAPVTLNPDQQGVLDALLPALEPGAGFSVHLLRGVTGSGKTEIYLRAARAVLDSGRAVLLLVPEIGLTPLLVSRLLRLAPGEVALLHSGLSEGERASAWEAVREGRARLVVGVRSAVFAPVPRLGLMVVDEEHDPSYRQEEPPAYHARDTAVKRAQLQKIPVLLGSATPSVESSHNAQAGRYRLLTLPNRTSTAPPPEVTVVNLADPALAGPHPFLSAPLVEALRQTMERGEQALLFLNRRGYSPFVICADCGRVEECPNCSVTLTYHRSGGVLSRDAGLVCHHCGHCHPVPTVCPGCGGARIKPRGAGTQRVEEALTALFPGHALGRLDHDTASRRGALTRLLERMDSGELSMLVGTQMLAKGHDFPRVTLVGVLNADSALDFPDFRSAERTYQLVAQVAGRAGRGERGGRIVVQTFHPEHTALRAALSGDYDAFFAEEERVRKAHGYPPWGRLGRVVVEGMKEQEVAETAAALAKKACRPGVRVLGPSPAPLARVLNRHRWHFLALAKDAPALHRALAPLREGVPDRLRVHLLVDAVNLF